MIRKMGGIQRNNNIPVLVENENITITEMLVEAIVKVYSNGNITDDMRYDDDIFIGMKE